MVQARKGRHNLLLLSNGDKLDYLQAYIVQDRIQSQVKCLEPGINRKYLIVDKKLQ